MKAQTDPAQLQQQANLANWEARVDLHAASATYDLAGYVEDPAKLSGVWRSTRPTSGI